MGSRVTVCGPAPNNNQATAHPKRSQNTAVGKNGRVGRIGGMKDGGNMINMILGGVCARCRNERPESACDRKMQKNPSISNHTFTHTHTYARARVPIATYAETSDMDAENTPSSQIAPRNTRTLATVRRSTVSVRERLLGETKRCAPPPFLCLL